MTKLLTLKKMKKKLVLLTLILVALLLSGCGLFSKHEHEYKWFDGEDYKTAYQKCTICNKVLDQSSLYQDPIYIRTQMLGDPDMGYLFYYEINVGSGKYNIGDEVEITISLKPDLPGYCKEGEFRIKISDSPYYEIVGDSEYVVSDFAKADFDLTKLLNFKFTIRPTSTCDLRERLNFKIKFNPTDYFVEVAKYFTHKSHYFYCDFSEEYFFTIGHIEYVIDSQGMLLGTQDNPLIYDSLNREYLAGAIDKDSYIDKLINYLSGGATIIYYDYNNAFHYLSGNIRAKTTINDEYSHLIGQYNSSEEENLHGIARDLLKIMLDNNVISSEMYETELQYLESAELKSKTIPQPAYFLVPFADYFRAHYYEIVVDINPNEHGHTSPAEGLYNRCIPSLSTDRIALGAEVELFVDANFTNDNYSYTITDAFGFNLVSNVTIYNGIMRFSLIHDKLSSKPYFSMEISIEDQSTYQIELYGFSENEMLYLSLWSEKDAVKVFEDYTSAETNTLVPTLEEIQNSLNTQNSTNSARSLLNNTIDTYISGEFYWQSTSTPRNNYPLRDCLISFYDREPNGERYLGSCTTDQDGRYIFGFSNDTSSSENGGLDITVRIWAAGDDVCVKYVRDGLIDTFFDYYEEYMLDDNISSGIHQNISKTFGMYDDEGNPYSFGRAIQIFQAANFASKYYERMKAVDVENIPIIYPYNGDDSLAFYKDSWLSNGKIYIKEIAESESIENSYPLRAFASWDTIMHEYGHFVSEMEELGDSPGGSHNLILNMSEHYMSHFTSPGTCNDDGCAFNYWYSSYNENDCKSAGQMLAWEEGFATYFSMVAQEYCVDFLGLQNVHTVGDGKFTGIGYSSDRDVDGFIGTVDSVESTVQAILYDMYDFGLEDYDTIILSHQTMWDLLIGSEAKTFDEFDNYFRKTQTNSDDLQKYNKLLSGHNLAPSSITVTGELTTYCPTFTWSWTEDSSTVFFNNRTYRLNFYDSNRSLIATTEEFMCTNNSYAISESLWQTILDNGSSFYVSVTIYENNDPITDYEGEWKLFNLPIIDASVGTLPQKTLSIGSCYWYKFTAPQTGDYTFKTTGDVDTFGEIFNQVVVCQSTSGIVSSYDSGGENNNFSFTKYMVSGESFYLRVRGKNWSSVGDFSLSVSYSPHVHNYTHRCRPDGNELHKAFCVCGAYIFENHTFRVTISKTYCTKCGYISVSDGPGFIVSITPGVTPSSEENDEESE